MGLEHFIHDRIAHHPDHPGQRSHLQRLQASEAKIREYRQERIVAHKTGEAEPRLIMLEDEHGYLIEAEEPDFDPNDPREYTDE